MNWRTMSGNEASRYDGQTINISIVTDRICLSSPFGVLKKQNLPQNQNIIIGPSSATSVYNVTIYSNVYNIIYTVCSSKASMHVYMSKKSYN